MAIIIYNNKEYSFSEKIPGRVIATIKSGRFYELKMLKFMSSLKTKGAVVDVGANIGNHSIFLAENTGCDKVYSFEAVPQIFEVLKENVKKNNLDKKIIPQNIAIGEKDGFCSVDYQPKMRGGIARVKSSKGKIPMRSLDSILINKQVGIIKIDVEGFEENVLKGSVEILKKYSPYIFIEAQDSDEKRTIDSILEPLGYRAKKVFNATATYFYAKNYPENWFSNLLLKIQGNRIFRTT